MEPTTTNKFGKGRLAAETEHFYKQLQKLLRLSEPVALLIARQAANDTARFSKLFNRPPTIREAATLMGSPSTCALCIVDSCVWLEGGADVGIDIEKSKPQLIPSMAKWVASVAAAVALNDGGTTAKRKVAAEAVKCPCCKQWDFGGQIEHAPNCPTAIQDALKKKQAAQPSQRQMEHRKINATIASNRRAGQMAMGMSVPTPRQSKFHGPSNCPPIISGGAIESNRRKH